MGFGELGGSGPVQWSQVGLGHRVESNGVARACTGAVKR